MSVGNVSKSVYAEELSLGNAIELKVRGDVRINGKVVVAHSSQATDGQTINLHSPFINIQVHDNPGALNMLLQGFVLDNTRIKV